MKPRVFSPKPLSYQQDLSGPTQSWLNVRRRQKKKPKQKHWIKIRACPNGSCQSLFFSFFFDYFISRRLLLHNQKQTLIDDWLESIPKPIAMLGGKENKEKDHAERDSEDNSAFENTERVCSAPLPSSFRTIRNASRNFARRQKQRLIYFILSSLSPSHIFPFCGSPVSRARPVLISAVM